MCTTPTTPTTTTPATTRGILLPCPLCGEASASITFNLADGETFNCGDCNSDFERAAVENFIAKWSKLLPWIDSMPTS